MDDSPINRSADFRERCEYPLHHRFCDCLVHISAIFLNACALIWSALMDQMFGMMMPKGAKRLKLSKMNMLGMGTEMMKQVMKEKNVDSLSQLITAARASGIKFVACSMSMDVMGIKKEELIDGIEIGGVAQYLSEADQSNMNLFI